MTDSIQLTIILTTHAKNDHFNVLLENVLQFKSSRYEIIVINDSADVVTAQFIESEIRKSDNGRVYIFEHDDRVGRGASLNEALVNASGSLIWAPLRADRVNESLLDDSIRRFKQDPAAFWVLDYSLPVSVEEWVEAAEEGDLPDDSCLVWNRNVIQKEQFFFNPFLDRLHGAELAYRLKESNVWYKTDPFFVVADNQSQHASVLDLQEFLYTSLRLNDEAEERKKILSELGNIQLRDSRRVSDNEFLTQARQLLQQGDAKRSLELIDKFLKRNPDHHEGLRIKVSSLEKLRRHVEAAELKHNILNLPKPPEEQSELELVPEDQKPDSDKRDTARNIEISVVIPTTGHGKPLLEAAMVHLEKAADESKTEVIVVDNASIDDTFEYLQQLKESNFLNIRVITNQTNRGFGASVNQGIEQAKGEYVMVMHNDVNVQAGTIQLLQRGFKHSDKVVVTVPQVSKTTVQAQSRDSEKEDAYVQTDKADSCCFMIKKSCGIRFDEEYGLCFFDMDDFCRQVKEEGFDMLVVRDTVVDHKGKSTISMMGLDLSPELKWKNRARLFEKWGSQKTISIPEEGSHPERFLKLGAPHDPMEPDPKWKEAVLKYLTNEVRTEILRGNWNEEELLTIVLTLLIADERELLRTMEDKLQNISPDRTLLTLFVVYYFRKNIYSRCRHYMDMDESGHPTFDLYRLKILVAEKEIEHAVPLLNRLLGEYPSNPELFYLAADMYEKSGEEGEAKSFYAMANQMNPFRFSNKDEAFDINL